MFTCTRVNKDLTCRSARVGIQRGWSCTHIKKLIFFSDNPTTVVRRRFRTGVVGSRRSAGCLNLGRKNVGRWGRRRA
jgi:hypothetical protein